MNRRVERLFRARANGLCEYCRTLELHSELQFVVDHIIAKQHRGKTHVGNLALACAFCNRPNVARIDPRTRRHTRLFNRANGSLERSFQVESRATDGQAPPGRATIVVLEMNHEVQLRARRALIRDGLFSPR